MPILKTQLSAKPVVLNKGQVHIPPPQAGMIQIGPCVTVLVQPAQAYIDALSATGQSIKPPISGRALVDTGASNTCIDDDAARNLGLPMIDQVQMTSASHAQYPANVYAIQFQIAGLPMNMASNRVIGAALSSQGLLMLIGRDLLSNCTLIYEGHSSSFSICI